MGAGEGQFENWSGDLQTITVEFSTYMNSSKQANDYRVVTKALYTYRTKVYINTISWKMKHFSDTVAYWHPGQTQNLK